MKSSITCFIIFVLAILNVMLAGCSKSPDDLYTEGKTQILDESTVKKGIEKLLLFENKFPQDPRIPEVILATATAYQSLKDFDKASETFEKLIDNYHGTAEAYKGLFLYGYMNYDLIKDEEKAKSILKKFIETYPDSELVVSARTLVENIGVPLEEWSIIKEIGVVEDK